MNATEAGEVHAMRRSIERFGVRLSKRSIDRIVRDIHSNRAICLKKQSASRTIFAVKMERYDQWLPVVYSSARKSIVTVLSESALQQYAKPSKAQAPRPEPSQPAPPPPPPAPPALKVRAPRLIPQTPQWSLEADMPPGGYQMLLTLGVYGLKLEIRVLLHLDDQRMLRCVEYGREIRTRWTAADRMIRRVLHEKLQGPRGVYRSEALYAQASEIIQYALRAKGIRLENEPDACEMQPAQAA